MNSITDKGTKWHEYIIEGKKPFNTFHGRRSKFYWGKYADVEISGHEYGAYRKSLKAFVREYISLLKSPDVLPAVLFSRKLDGINIKNKKFSLDKLLSALSDFVDEKVDYDIPQGHYEDISVNEYISICKEVCKPLDYMNEQLFCFPMVEYEEDHRCWGPKSVEYLFSRIDNECLIDYYELRDK
ncbi:hypothetical protein AGMMS49965_15160 [Bacteroidia bacterium]|nr:hypothetical protein AGMMS49965_15160 [Bacteroidia bacterium]